MMINLTFLGGLILSNRYTLDNIWMLDNCMILLFKGISNYYKYLKFETNKETMYTIIVTFFGDSSCSVQLVPLEHYY